jgi:hypothetical protein
LVNFAPKLTHHLPASGLPPLKKSLSSYQFSRYVAQFEVSETVLSNASPLAIRFRLGQISELAAF